MMRDILIVEDGLHERERLDKVFTAAGYSVCTAESAQDAEALLARESFRLAILDIGLGDKSGSHLFEIMRRSNRVPYVIILTGNPSTHLKQKFLDEGAVAYIVKASQAASNENLHDLIRSLLGGSQVNVRTGIPLREFITNYLTPSSRELFTVRDQQIPPCASCGGIDFIVVFDHKTQLPPQVEGTVVCAHCSKDFDPEVG